MRKFVIPLSIILLIEISNACNSNSQSKQEFAYLPFDKYKYEEGGIQAGTAVKVLGFSGGRQSETGELYYYQFLVLNESTGDTLRILAPSIGIEETGEPGSKVMTTPWQFNGEKGVTDAVYEVGDSLQDLTLKIQSLVKNGQLDTSEKIESLHPRVEKKEFVVVNKSIPEFDHPHYKAAIGILVFKKIPW